MIDPRSLRLSELEAKHQLPPGLLAAVAQTESSWNPNAVSPKGAQGLFQFMPKTAESYGIDPRNPQQAAEGAARMYGDLLKQYGGDVKKALAAYNWGSGNIQRKGLENMPTETKDYIRKVTSALPQYAQADTGIMSDAAPVNAKPNFKLMLEAEKRGILPPNKAQLLAEARKRGLVGGDAVAGGVAEPQDTTGIGRTALEQGLQGATFGFGDEVMDRIGALIASKVTGEDYGALLEEARKMSQSRLKTQMEERPELSIASNLAGGLLTGGVGASTKAGAAVARSLGTGSTALRMGKGALAGLSSGALYGAGTGQEGERLESAGQGALAGGLIGGAIPSVAPAIRGIIGGSKSAARGLSVRGAEELGQAAAQQKAVGSALYKKMRDAGAILSNNTSNKIVNRIDTSIKSTGKLNDRLHGDTLSVMEDFRGAAQKGDLSLEELDQFRQLFQDSVRKNTVNGMANPDAQRSQQAIKVLDRLVSGLGDKSLQKGDIAAVKALQQGRKEWAKYRRFETLQDLIVKAGGDPNKIKSSLTRFANNKKNVVGWSAEEKQALANASKMTGGEQILKGLGRFGIEPNNVFLPAVGGGLSAIAGSGVAGAYGVAAGTASRQLYKLIARDKAEQLLRVIESGNQQQINNAVAQLPKKQIPQVMKILGLSQASSVPARNP